jgi:hypothetical protein
MAGAMGEGERGPAACPPHPCADELVTLLLETGADPNEAQGLYNTQFTASIDKWLPLLILRIGAHANHFERQVERCRRWTNVADPGATRSADCPSI